MRSGDSKRPQMVALGISLLMVAAIAGTARAQRPTIVSGTVSARDGAVLPGARVTARDVVSNRQWTAVADDSGRFELGLQAGNFRLRAFAEGFSDGARNISIATGDSVTEDFELDLGTIAEELTVTASKGVERETAKVPQIVTIVDSDDLEDRQIESVAEAIARAPNVRIIDQNPARSRPQYRGLGSSRVLILVDGERLNNVRFDAGATGVSPSMIDVAQVESIEVLGGAGSSIYGSDSMSGVINIITKQPERSVGGSGLDLSFDTTYNANREYAKSVVTGSYAGEKFALRANVSRFELEGWRAGDGSVSAAQVLDFARFSQEVAAATGGDAASVLPVWEFKKGERVANSRGEGVNFQADLWFYPSDGHNFRLKYLTSQHEDLGQPFSAPPTDPIQRSYPYRDLDKFTLDYEAFDLAGWLPRLSVRAYRQSFERPQNESRFNIDPGSSYDAVTGTLTGNLSTFTRGREESNLWDVESTGAEIKINIQPWRDAILTTGLSWLEDESSDTLDFVTFDGTGQNERYGESGVATTPDSEYENRAFFAALEWAPETWLRLAGGLRYDRWKTAATPGPRYPPVQERFIVETSLPLIHANPGDLNLAGIGGVGGLVDGTSGIETDNDVWTTNLGLTFITPHGINPFIRWAESYREPEITVRYIIRNFGSPSFFVTALPNSELQAEEGETLDVGVKIHRAGWRGTLTYFENDVENFIGTTLSDLVFSPDLIRPDLGLFSPVGIFLQRINFGEVSFKGWEATWEGSFVWGNKGTFSPYFQLSHLTSRNKTPTRDALTTVNLFYNRTDTPHRFEGSADDVPFGNVIEDQGLLGIRYSAASNRWFVEYELEWVEELNRVDPGDLSNPIIAHFGYFASLAGYEKHSVRGGYEFATKMPIEVALGVENLADEFYFDPYQPAPAPGRSFIFSLRIAWNDIGK